MNENNGKGIFYGVIGVATLIVAIIGATFAYFSASQTNDDTIQGETNTDLASGLSISVSKVKWQGATAGSDKLVPAKFKNEVGSLDATDVNNALSNKCISGGFTGCHVWRIEASSKQDLTTASIYLDLKVNSAKVVDEDTKWSYAIFKTNGDEAPYSADTEVDNLTATQVTEQDTFNSISNLGTDIHSGATMTKETPIVYYLLVYLANDEGQDQTASVTGEDGHYTGTVTLSVAGTGQVKASFVAN